MGFGQNPYFFTLSVYCGTIYVEQYNSTNNSETKNKSIEREKIMKKIGILIFILCFSAQVWGNSFSTFAELDEENMKRIVGKWKFSDRIYLYEYTDDYMTRIDGFPYYQYKISQYPRSSNYIYAIFKSKKTGKSYFCRGHYSHKTGFRHSASRIVFESEDKFVVYTEDDPHVIFFIAERIKPQTQANAKTLRKKNNKK